MVARRPAIEGGGDSTTAREGLGGLEGGLGRLRECLREGPGVKLSILYALARVGRELRVSELAKVLGRSITWVSRNVRELERCGAVEVASSGRGRRGSYVRLKVDRGLVLSYIEEAGGDVSVRRLIEEVDGRLEEGGVGEEAPRGLLYARRPSIEEALKPIQARVRVLVAIERGNVGHYIEVLNEPIESVDEVHKLLGAVKRAIREALRG